MTNPTPVNSLEDIRDWCLKASEGDEKNFLVVTEVTRREASAFAFDVNQKRDYGDVRIEVEGDPAISGGELTTRVNVRCTN